MRTLLRYLRYLAKVFAVGIGGLVLLLGLIWVGIVLNDRYQFHHGFDLARWLDAGQQLKLPSTAGGITDWANPRESMVPDLVAHYLKPGMTRPQVEALLGSPERVVVEPPMPPEVPAPDSLTLARYHGYERWLDAQAPPATILRYRVGFDLVDPTSLRVQLDSSGKVKRCWVGIH